MMPKDEAPLPILHPHGALPHSYIPPFWGNFSIHLTKKLITECQLQGTPEDEIKKKTSILSKMLHKGEKNLGKFSASRKGWRLHPHLALLNCVMRIERPPCNKESRHCNIEIVAAQRKQSKFCQ
jgi:hypothetical protein